MAELQKNCLINRLQIIARLCNIFSSIDNIQILNDLQSYLKAKNCIPNLIDLLIIQDIPENLELNLLMEISLGIFQIVRFFNQPILSSSDEKILLAKMSHIVIRVIKLNIEEPKKYNLFNLTFKHFISFCLSPMNSPMNYTFSDTKGFLFTPKLQDSILHVYRQEIFSTFYDAFESSLTLVNKVKYCNEILQNLFSIIMSDSQNYQLMSKSGILKNMILKIDIVEPNTASFILTIMTYLIVVLHESPYQELESIKEIIKGKPDNPNLVAIISMIKNLNNSASFFANLLAELKFINILFDILKYILI